MPGTPSSRMRHDEALQRYLNEIRDFPRLTPADERALGERAQAGDESAREQLVVSNLRLVVHIARTFYTRELSLLDLIQEGTIGLMRAAEKFEPRSETNFAHYAGYWIRQTIGRAIIRRDSAVILPDHLHQQRQQVRRLAAHLTVTLGRVPTAEEIAAAAHLSVERVQRLAALPSGAVASLDEPLHNELLATGDVLGDLLADTPEVSLEEQLEQDDEHNRLRELLREHLDERELAVLSLRYRLNGLANAFAKSDRLLAYRQVAAQLGISGEMARQIEGQALTKLRMALSMTPDGVAPKAKRSRKPKQPKQPATAPTAPTTAQSRRPRNPKPPKQLSLFGDVA